MNGPIDTTLPPEKVLEMLAMGFAIGSDQKVDLQALGTLIVDYLTAKGFLPKQDEF